MKTRLLTLLALLCALVLLVPCAQPAFASALSGEQMLDAYYTLITLSINKEDYEAAVTYIDKALGLCPEDNVPLLADLWLKKGCMYAALLQYDQALPALEMAISLDDTLADAYLVASSIYVETGDMTRATAYMEQYAQRSPDSPEGYVNLAQLYFSDGRYADAETVYTAYIGTLGAQDLSAYYMRGVCRLQNAKYAEAAEDFTLSLADATLQYNALYNRGVCAMQLGDIAHAADDFSACIDAGEQIDGLYYNRGVCRMNLADYQGAADDFAASAQAGQYAENSLYNQASCLLQLGEYEPSAQRYGEYLALVGVYDAAAYYRGICYLSLEQYDKAIADFSAWMEWAQQNIPPDENGLTDENVYWARHYRAASRAALGAYEEAIADYTQNIQAGQLLAVSYYNRSRCYLQTGQGDLAEQDLLMSVQYQEVEAAPPEAAPLTAPAGE